MPSIIRRDADCDRSAAVPPSISVIVPVLNGAAFVAKAIRSALSQTRTDLEVVVVDNGSTDATWSIVCGMAAQDGRIRAAQAPDQRGAAAARNVCLALARGEWIAVLDADDEMHPTRLHHLLDFAAGRGADLVADNLYLVDGDGNVLRTVWDAATLPDSVDAAEYILRNLASWRQPDLGWAKPVFRRRLVDGTGLRYHTGLRLGEDSQFLFSLLRAGTVLHLLPEPLYCYAQCLGSLAQTWSEDDLRALLEVNRAEIDAAAANDRLRAALLRQRDSLQVQLVHFAFVDAVKRGRLDRAVGLALGHPPVLPRIAHFGMQSLRKRLPRWRYDWA